MIHDSERKTSEAKSGARTGGGPSRYGEGRMEPVAAGEKALDRFFGWLMFETDFGSWEPSIQAEVRTRLTAELDGACRAFHCGLFD